MRTPRSTAAIFGHPIHPMIVPFPITFLIAALFTDIAYWQTRLDLWASASTWLIGVGVGTALMAAVAGFIDFGGSRNIRAIRKSWYHMITNLIVVVLSAANFAVHMRDGEMAVLPTGIALSAIVATLLAFSAWMGGELVFRHGVGVHLREPTL